MEPGTWEKVVAEKARAAVGAVMGRLAGPTEQ